MAVMGSMNCSPWRCDRHRNVPLETFIKRPWSLASTVVLFPPFPVQFQHSSPRRDDGRRHIKSERKGWHLVIHCDVLKSTRTGAEGVLQRECEEEIDHGFRRPIYEYRCVFEIILHLKYDSDDKFAFGIVIDNSSTSPATDSTSGNLTQHQEELLQRAMIALAQFVTSKDNHPPGGNRPVFESESKSSTRFIVRVQQRVYQRFPGAGTAGSEMTTPMLDRQYSSGT